jgi:hypothetical protein
VSSSDDLFDRVGAVLTPRGNWNYEPSPTPGAAPSWCLDPGGEVALAVVVLDGQICAYLPDDDREIHFRDLDELTRWLDANEATYRR